MTREELRNGRFLVGLCPFELMTFLGWEEIRQVSCFDGGTAKQFPEIPQISELLPNQGNVPFTQSRQSSGIHKYL
jgi:hypothetical protein